MNSYSNPHRPLKNSYIRKVMRGLKNIKMALAKVRANPNDHNSAMEIRGIAEAISELAMMYGYQGVESIAQKISTSFKLSRVIAERGFLAKVERAIKGIQDVVILEERVESELIIKRITRVDTEPFAQVSNLDELEEEQHRMVELESDAKLLFDITETNFLSNTSVVLISKKPKLVSEQVQTRKAPS